MTATADAVVIGSGPNGLVAAITLARAGWEVVLLERASVAGGAVRSEQLTKPGFVHDTFSAFYGLLHASPVFRELDLGARVPWAHFDVPVGAATSRDTAAVIHRDVDRTAAALGADGDAWRDLVRWWQKVGTRFFAQMLRPIGAVGPALRFLAAARPRGALDATQMLVAPVEDVARDRFRTETAQVLLASGISHSDLGVDAVGSTSLSLILAMLAQTVGMPVPVGGAGVLAAELAQILQESGGSIRLGDPVEKVHVQGDRARAVTTAGGETIAVRHAVLADTGPRALFLDLVGAELLPDHFVRGVRRYRYGTGVFKIDLALTAPVPWHVDDLRSCGVVHLMGGLDTMARSAFETRRGLLPAAPLLVVGQQTIADPSRAPKGSHTLWVECHVPSHPRGDAASDTTYDGWQAARKPFFERVLDRIEEHAPGFRERIDGWAVNTPADLESMNPNLVGGDVNGGTAALPFQLIFRPVPGWFRYRTPIKGLYLCSASAHPGGGVHGMAGRNAAKRALRDSWKPGGVVRTAGSARRLAR